MTQGGYHHFINFDILMTMKYKYFDIHSHLNFSDFNEDREEVIKKMRDEGVGAISVGIDLETSKEVVDLADKYDNIFATIGLEVLVPPVEVLVPPVEVLVPPVEVLVPPVEVLVQTRERVLTRKIIKNL